METTKRYAPISALRTMEIRCETAQEMKMPEQVAACYRQIAKPNQP